MRPLSPPHLWLLGVCVLPGVTVLATGLLRPPTPPRHRHVWAPFHPPGGTLRLLDARSHPLTTLQPGQMARLDCLPDLNVDRCRRPGRECAFGMDGTVVESEGLRLLDFADGGAGGQFGRLEPGGRFYALSPRESNQATHYLAGRRLRGTFCFTARFDDHARTRIPDGPWISTYDDPPTESPPVWVTIGTPGRR